MKRELTVTIAGGAGHGKTLVGVLLAKFLQGHGCNVEMEYSEFPENVEVIDKVNAQLAESFLRKVSADMHVKLVVEHPGLRTDQSIGIISPVAVADEGRPELSPYPLGQTEITGDQLAETLPRGAVVTLRSCGNPGKGQDPDNPIPGVPGTTYPVKNLKFAAAACRTFILNYGLLGGNWAGGDVLVNDEVVAYVSYNGRVWEKRP